MNCPKIVTVQVDIYIKVESPTMGHNQMLQSGFPKSSANDTFLQAHIQWVAQYSAMFMFT